MKVQERATTRKKTSVRVEKRERRKTSQKRRMRKERTEQEE